MKNIKVAINGFGRIGRVFTRAVLETEGIEIVAINDLVDPNTLAHLMQYDSVHGKYQHKVSVVNNEMVINNNSIKVFSERNPEDLPWGDLNVDIVVESTGIFRSVDTASKHINAGANKVIISAPATDAAIKTIVLGINDSDLKSDDVIVSNASCTTNCAAPMVQIVNQLCGISEGFITTTHAYTGDQNIHDAPHKDLRRTRAAAQNIIPTSTGAAKAIGKIFPELNGKLEGIGIRVPVIDGSMTDLICKVDKPISADDLRKAFSTSSNAELKGILAYTEDPIVSVDVIGDPHSCIIDGKLITVMGDLVRVIGWYDNEAGYSNRLVDLIKKMA
jgi:glyceraldehyde 3-phosphate dehydrogenase